MELVTFPRVVVFDLDSTLWEGDIEYATIGPPYRWDKRFTLRDRQNNRLPIFEDAFGIMAWLKEAQSLDLSTPDDRQKLLAAVPDQRLLNEVKEKFKNQNLEILDNLSEASTAYSTHLGPYLEVAYASRPYETTWAPQALKEVIIPNCTTSFWDIAVAAEIYPGEKSKHLTRIARAAKCPLSQIILYDNEQRNIYTANKIGAFGKLTYDGLSWRKFLEGLFEYQIRQGGSL